ncbi:hypothetical protein ACNQFZ_20740 [Schinkia sp. CFF1]
MEFVLKEWKEMYRSRIIFSAVVLILAISLLIIRQMIGYNSEITFSQMAVPLFQANLYFIPLLSMIIASFSIQHEQLQKTLPILLSRYLLPNLFFVKKSIALHLITSSTIIISYFFVLFFSKFFMYVSIGDFFYFVLSMLFISIIYVQIGCFLGSITENRIQLLSYILIIWFFSLFVYDLILMYYVPSIQSSNVLLFSIFYFLSPINSVRYFLNVKLGIFDLESFPAIFDQFTFHSPSIILLLNLTLFIGVFFGAGFRAIKKGAIKE